jgi:hypothetical protein
VTATAVSATHVEEKAPGIYVAIINGRVKVGYTGNLTQRLKKLGSEASQRVRRTEKRQVPNVLPVVLVAFVPMPSAGAAFDREQEVHAKFREHAIRVKGAGVSETYPLELLPDLVAEVFSESAAERISATTTREAR